MHITTVCPSCQTRYQVAPTLRGTRIRCPNPVCKQPFEVREVAESAAPPPAAAPTTQKDGGSQASGSVGDLVPLLRGEEARPPAPEVVPESQVKLLPDDPLSWRQGPPPVRRAPDATPRPPEPPQPAAKPAPPPPVPAPPPPQDPADWRSAPPPQRAPAAPAARAETKPPPPKPVEQERRTRGGQRRSAQIAPPAPPAVEPVQELPARLVEVPTRLAGDVPLAPAEPARVVTADWQAPPPVRHPDAPTDDAAHPEEAPQTSRARKRNFWLTLSVVAVFFVILGVGAGVYIVYSRGAEDRLRAKAEREFDDGRYPNAATEYKQLLAQFPESLRAGEYRERLAVSELLTSILLKKADPNASLEDFKKFLTEKAPAAKTYARQIGQGMADWLRNTARTAQENGDALTPETVARAREVLADAAKRLPEGFTAEELAQLDDLLRKAEVVVAQARERRLVLDQLKKLGDNPSVDTIRQARELIKQEARKQPGFDQNPEAIELLRKLYEGHAAQVTYTRMDMPLDAPRLAEDAAPGLLVEHLTDGFPTPAKANDAVVLALARGVLYALSEADGRIVWAMRVGIDTSRLPLRVPAGVGRPEMVLALSADTESLTALDARSGDQLWKYRLSAPCLGQPVVVDLRAYIPTYDGIVHEIELAKGQLLGQYRLGKGTKLTVGGTRQEGTKLVWFPADDTCVYGLDVAEQKCQAVLYSEHPSGSLRSEPILASPGPRHQGAAFDPNAPDGYLILAQTTGLDAMQLRVFGLPIQDPHAPPLPMPTAPTVRGWPWFQPYHDPEKLVLVTDAGVVGLFGVRQVRNQDYPLFPLLPKELLLGGDQPADGAKAGRAQVVFAQGDELWVLAHGGLQKLALTLDPRIGPRLAVDRHWAEPLLLGSPLHRSQADATGSTLFLVTQALQRNACLATAVEADSRRIRWQRQLGMLCRGEPLTVGPEVLALDQGGGAFSFNPAAHPDRADLQWQVGGLALAKPVEENPDFPPTLYPGTDGASAYEVALPGRGTHLQVRRFARTEAGKVTVEERDKPIELSSPAAGEAAVGANSLLLPLKDGQLLRLRLAADGGRGLLGAGWRTGMSAADVRPFVTWINADAFLTTDGGRGLTHWVWPQGKEAVALPAERDDKSAPTVELPARIVSAPAVLPRPDGMGELQVVVADASGSVTLLAGDLLQVRQRWDLGGRITAGPFVRGASVGCVVDGRRLVWLEAGKKESVWEYKTSGEEIVGQPRLVEGMLVVADRLGRFVGLDPTTGRRLGPGYTLRASAVPAASPVGFGPQRAFAPLSDGTVLLLSLYHLRDPLREVPTVW